jgi:hypothetical protein
MEIFMLLVEIIIMLCQFPTEEEMKESIVLQKYSQQSLFAARLCKESQEVDVNIALSRYASSISDRWGLVSWMTVCLKAIASQALPDDIASDVLKMIGANLFTHSSCNVHNMLIAQQYPTILCDCISEIGLGNQSTISSCCVWVPSILTHLLQTVTPVSSTAIMPLAFAVSSATWNSEKVSEKIATYHRISRTVGEQLNAENGSKLELLASLFAAMLSTQNLSAFSMSSPGQGVDHLQSMLMLFQHLSLVNTRYLCVRLVLFDQSVLVSRLLYFFQLQQLDGVHVNLGAQLARMQSLGVQILSCCITANALSYAQLVETVQVLFSMIQSSSQGSSIMSAAFLLLNTICITIFQADSNGMSTSSCAATLTSDSQEEMIGASICTKEERRRLEQLVVKYCSSLNLIQRITSFIQLCSSNTIDGLTEVLKGNRQHLPSAQGVRLYGALDGALGVACKLVKHYAAFRQELLDSAMVELVAALLANGVSKQHKHCIVSK